MTIVPPTERPTNANDAQQEVNASAAWRVGTIKNVKITRMKDIPRIVYLYIF